jgi:hypothetical protein
MVEQQPEIAGVRVQGVGVPHDRNPVAIDLVIQLPARRLQDCHAGDRTTTEWRWAAQESNLRPWD